MTAGKATIAGVLFPLLLLAAVWALLIPHGPADRDLLHAEFQDVGLLVPGDDVRIAGATSGTVQDVRLTDHGTAVVRFRLDGGVRPLRADATASVRDADLLGGTFLAVERGHAAAPLRAPIPTARTFVAARVQDMFDTLDAPTRTALRTLVAELGVALDQHGGELNRAVLTLAPALRAAREAGDQLGSQDAQLGRAIVQVQRLTAQLAPRHRDAARLVDGLDRTLATTAARARDLDRGVAVLPRTLRQLRGSLAELDTAATAVRPAAQTLAAAAPQLTLAAQRLTPFSRQTQAALTTLRPLLRTAAQTLAAGRRTLPRLRRASTTLTQTAPAVTAFAQMVQPYAGYLVKGVFGGIGGLAAEPGTQPLANQPGRNYFRGEAVLGCETFGLPTRPGCLAGLVTGMAKASEKLARRGTPTGGSGAAGAPADHGGDSGSAAGPGTAAPTPRTPAPPAGPIAAATEPLRRGVGALLDYLLRP
jgi:phospholipid/cholesterol/gamma-HCH transport system substrate-binding protein